VKGKSEMALAISNIPVLSGEAAIRFVRTAEENARNRGRIDFSVEREMWRNFESENANRVRKLRESGKWPF
jgi:hypothetical protein